MKNSLKNKGFTLIEVLVASSLFVVAIATAIGTFTLSTGIQTRNFALREGSQNARFIIEAMARDIRGADSFYIDNVNDSLVLTKSNQDFSYSLKTIGNQGNIYYSNGVEEVPLLMSQDITIDNFNIDGVDSTELVSSQEQSYLDIEMKFTVTKGTRDRDKASQTVKTSISTRAYLKGFNDQITQN